MKNVIIISLLALFSLSVNAQFVDDFTDGNFTSAPPWSGDVSKFEVNPAKELWLNAPSVADTAILTTPFSAINNATWQFYVKMDFDPSSSNYSRVYLMSNNNNLKGALDGYFVQIGGVSGNTDDISLYKQSGNSITKIIDGIDGTVAATPEIKVKITRGVNGNWELLSDTNNSGSYVSEGTVTDNSFTYSNFFGVFCKYTSSRSDKFFFDDFSLQGTIPTDITPPKIVNLKVVDHEKIDLLFDEPVDPITSQDPSNYVIDDGGLSFTTAIQDIANPKLIHLRFNPFKNLKPHKLEVKNIKDQSGNAIVSQIRYFKYHYYVQPKNNYVSINEILADFSPQVKLPKAEYIELYNPFKASASGYDKTDTVFNLKGWTLADKASTSSAFDEFYLWPNNYVVICKRSDSILFTSYAGTNAIDFIFLDKMPSLNNTDDEITLRTADGTLIDKISYNDTWYGNDLKKKGGWSLEQKNPFSECDGKYNWLASSHNDGGTPGLKNSQYNILPDNSPPQLVSWKVSSKDTVDIFFSEILDSSNIKSGTYQLVNAANSITVTVSEQLSNGAKLSFSPALKHNFLYKIKVSGITDCPGNIMSDTSFEFSLGVDPEPYDLLINEAYIVPRTGVSPLPKAQYIELYNRTRQAIKTDKLKFSDLLTEIQIPSDVILPGEHVILCEKGFESSFRQYGKVFPMEDWPILNKTKDVIKISKEDTIIDIIQYEDSWYKDDIKKKGGWSLELKNSNDPCLGALNWSASTNNNGGTPGKRNSVESGSNYFRNELSSITVNNDSTITLNFTRTFDTTTLSNSNITIVPSQSIRYIRSKAPWEKNIVIEFNHPLKKGGVYRITLDNLYDCTGQKINTKTLSFILPDWNNIVVNEVLFNPRDGGSDYVEIYNKSGTSIDLKNWSFATVSSSGDTTYKPLATKHLMIPDGDYFVFTENKGNILFEYSDAVEKNIFETDLPSYSNSSGRVILATINKKFIDDFSYSESMHFKLIDNVKGVSLERINVNRNTNDQTNWHSASSQVNYGTPGYKNSQFSNNVVESDNINIEPEIFSPDNDGHEDNVDITYRFPKEGYLATIKIYDQKGREVRLLANNSLLQKEGAISWDGIMNNGEKAPVGIYILLVEVFDLKGNTKRFKKTCVVATKL